MNRWIVLALTGSMAAFGAFTPRTPVVADPPVNLQAATPGSKQTGHVNVSGTVIGGNFVGQTSGSGGKAVSGRATLSTTVTYGGFFQSDSNNGRGVYGLASLGSGSTFGGYFETHSTSGQGAIGEATAGTGTTYGLHGRSSSTSGRGVFGEAVSGSGVTYGVYGRTSSTSGRGVFGDCTGVNGSAAGGYFQSASTAGYGVFGDALATSGNSYGGYFRTASPTGKAVYGVATDGSGANFGGEFLGGGGTSSVGVHGVGGIGGKFESSTVNGNGVRGTTTGSGGVGVYGQGNNTNGKGVLGSAPAVTGVTYGGFFTSASNSGTGAYAEALADSGTTYGVYGRTNSAGGSAVYGRSTAGGVGVTGRSEGVNGVGVVGEATNISGTPYGVYGSAPAPGFGIYALGNMGASGTKPFRIDHPLDPENKYLLHYASESPQPQNFYNGNVVTDQNGDAWVQLPDYFEEINRDFRYQLTVVDEEDFAMARVARKIRGNRFLIKTSRPRVEVCWEVKALRNDLWVRKYGAPTVAEKDSYERGTYQHPELYEQPKEKGLTFKRSGGISSKIRPSNSKS